MNYAKCNVLVGARTAAALNTIKPLLEGQPFNKVHYQKDYDAFLLYLQKHNPNIVILNINTHNQAAVSAATFVAQLKACPPTVIICNKLETQGLKKIMQLGLKCIVPHHCSADDLSQAINAAVNNQQYISKHILYDEPLLTDINKTARFALTEPLSDREFEVLESFCEGLGLTEVADALHISEKTVETHKKNMLKKFNVNALAKMIALAYKNKMVE
jgi:DNA-binding NarL/FixJ family response regulator